VELASLVGLAVTPGNWFPSRGFVPETSCPRRPGCPGGGQVETRESPCVTLWHPVMSFLGVWLPVPLWGRQDGVCGFLVTLLGLEGWTWG
jgi:hypothetical protein